MISIIMPTYNRFKIAEYTIQKTISISSDIEFELIVVNDGQPLPFSIQHPVLQIVKNPGKGVASARNYGVSLSKYPVLFFIDDDMWITARTLTLIAELYQKQLLENAHFNFNWEYPSSLQQKLASNKIGRFILNSKYHTLEGRSHMTIDYSLPIVAHDGVGSCSFCISKSNFTKVGGYDIQIEFQGEDTDLAKRLLENKIQPKLITEITCYHNQEDRLDIFGFTDRIYRGFLSQARAGMVSTSATKKYFLFILLPFYKIIEWLFQLTPNHIVFDKISFRLIGVLSSLSFAKAIRDAKA